ncbi:MAG: hypothetical protein IT428_24300 [Planctomycetaceae bacterium]|jgi:hypothetical protein|nr:hypothetical protein [Planctomycetaceae bacterium]
MWLLARFLAPGAALVGIGLLLYGVAYPADRLLAVAGAILVAGVVASGRIGR